MKRKLFVVTAVFISSQLPGHVFAQQDSTRSLDEVILTSNKYPKKQSETGKVVTVINRAQIDKSGGKSLGEVLNTVAGTTVIGANNNPGTNQTISLRGASSGNVLILIDGIPAYDPSVNTNYFDLNLISIDQIERIEILKGGQSTLYGSDAVAGVVNIISRKSGTKKFSINGTMTGGSYNTLKQAIDISGRTKVVNWSAGYTHINSDGFSAAYDSTGNKRFDDDGFNQHVVTARVGVKLSDHVQLNGFSTYSQYHTDLDASAFTDEKDYSVKNDNVQGGGGLVVNHSKGAFHLNYNFNYVERDYFDDSVYKASPFTDWSKGRYIGRSHYAEAYNSWKLDKWEVLAGIDYRLNNTDQFYFSSGPFGPYAPLPLSVKMNQVSPYASVIYKLKNGFTTELGGRWNNHSEYGSNFTFTLNPSWLFNQKIKTFINLYSAFKTPTLYQLFDHSAGNAELDPEKGLIGEAGVEVFEGNTFRVRVVGFYRHTKDAIVYTSNPTTFAAKYLNASEQKNWGGELEANYAIGKLTLTANYTFTDGETTSPFDGTGAPIGKDTTYYNLYRIPKHAINFTAGVQATNHLYISGHVRSVSKREEFVYGSSPLTLDSYTTIDLYTEYKFSGLFKAFVDLRNITNKEYFDFRGYNSRKFNFTAGLNFRL